MATGNSVGEDLAFPFVETRAMQGESINLGLTKRELFAAMAMQGIMAGLPIEAVHSARTSAFLAVEHADALILALSRKDGDHV